MVVRVTELPPRICSGAPWITTSSASFTKRMVSFAETPEPSLAVAITVTVPVFSLSLGVITMLSLFPPSNHLHRFRVSLTFQSMAASVSPSGNRLALTVMEVRLPSFRLKRYSPSSIFSSVSSTSSLISLTLGNTSMVTSGIDSMFSFVSTKETRSLMVRLCRRVESADKVPLDFRVTYSSSFGSTRLHLMEGSGSVVSSSSQTTVADRVTVSPASIFSGFSPSSIW